MSKPGFSIHFKSKNPTSKPAPVSASPRVVFRGANESDDEHGDDLATSPAFAKSESKNSNPSSPKSVFITELDLNYASIQPLPPDKHVARRLRKKKNLPPPEPPMLKLKSKLGSSTTGDMSTALTARKHLDEAASADSTIFDYDGVYDSLKATAKSRKASGEDEELDPETGARKSKYMSSLLTASAVRTRDHQIAEEKRIARERAAEGDAYADKEKFVTAAYKKQQEENARIAEEEQKREEEARRNGGEGMTGFYRELLEEDERRNLAAVKAADEAAAQRRRGGGCHENGVGRDSAEEDEERREAEGNSAPEKTVAREINAMGGNVLVNDDGEVVDKRELLRSGLNLAPSKRMRIKDQEQQHLNRQNSSRGGEHGCFSPSSRNGPAVGSKATAMRTRQSRMLEQQLAQQLKRSLDKADDERTRVERAAKSRKTEHEVSSARERYLARKRAAASAGGAEGE